MSTELEFAVELSVDGVDNHHPSVEKAGGELVADLRDAPGVQVSIRRHATEGAKGVLETVLIMVLPVAIPAAIRVFHLWLGQDRDRSMSVTIKTEDGSSKTFEVDGKNISLEPLQHALAEAAEVRREDKKK